MEEARAVDVLLAPDCVSRPLESVESFREFVVTETARRLQYRDDFKLRWQKTQLKMQHQTALREAFEAVEQAQTRWNNSPIKPRHDALLEEVNRLVLQLNGYRTFLEKHSELVSRVAATPPEDALEMDEDTKKLVVKLQKSQAKADELEEQLAARQSDLNSCVVEAPELHALKEAIAAEQRLKDELGFTELERAIKEADKAIGTGWSDRGSSYETKVSNDVMVELAKSFASVETLADGSAQIDEASMIVLKNVTLGSANAELDFLVCVASAREVPPPPQKNVNRKLPATSVDVLAIVEVKREPNDVGYAVMRYYEYMPWFAGDETRYEAKKWVTNYYTKGHFSRPYYQPSVDGKQYYVFTPESFQKIYDPTSPVPSGLHIVTRPRRLCSISSKMMATLFHKACSDKAMVAELSRLLNIGPVTEHAATTTESSEDGTDDATFNWEELWQGAKEEFGAEDVLRMYAADPVAACRIHLLRD